MSTAMIMGMSKCFSLVSKCDEAVSIVDPYEHW